MILKKIALSASPVSGHGRRPLASAAAALLALGAHMGAQAVTLTVPSTADIWLAGQPNGSSVSGYFGSDTAPDNAPVSLDVTEGSVMSFAATGSTSVDGGGCYAGPDGGCYSDESSFSPAPASGAYIGPSNALVGVFVGSTPVDVANTVAPVNYTDPTNTSQASYAPGLNTIFFIGDGLTGTGDGLKQTFAVPLGATRLVLALADSIGASTGNLGEVSVNVSVSAVPEAESYALFLAGVMAVVGLNARRRRA